MRRIAITGARSPLGQCLIDDFKASSDVECVRGVYSHASRRVPSPSDKHSNEDVMDCVPFVPDHRMMVEYLEKEQIDTVIQCGLAPDRSGLGSTQVEADVIATMCLGAAIGHEGSPVRNWVLASSSAIYPIDSHAALMQVEGSQIPRQEESISGSIAEAEDYARDLAYRLPHVNVAIMRLQQLVGPGVHGPLATLLARKPVPTLIGFDPAVQFLHLHDAASAMAFAARSDLAGLYNVASAGLIRWRDAVRRTGHSSIPLLPIGAAPFEPLLRTLRIPFVPAELQDVLRFGHVVDIQKLERVGWHPNSNQADCIHAVQSESRPRRRKGKS